MVRYGTVSVGVALEQETTSYRSCANSGSNHPLLNSSGTSLLYDPNSSASVTTTHHQSLRITFAYQGATRTMSDVIITLSDQDQQQLVQNGALTALERGALLAQSKNKTDPNHQFFNESNELQVYTVEPIKGNDKVYIEEIPVTPVPSRKAICNSSENSTEETKENKTKENDENNNETEKTKNGSGNATPENEKKSGATQQKQIKKANSTETKENKKNKGKVRESSVSESLGKVETESNKGDKQDKEDPKPKRPVRCRQKPYKAEHVSPERERRARSMSKSRIPIINSAAHEYYPCEYYRRKLMCDHGVCDYHTCWLNFPAMQKSAGQKVVKKITAQQKKLEEDAAATKKKVEFMLEEDEHPTKPLKALIPMRKRPSRLEPILVRRK